MKALIVDDDITNAHIFARCLTMWGWDCDVSTAASDAADLFKRNRYDLALCDVVLQGVDGIILARAFALTQPSVAVIITSGDPSQLARARRTGFARCLGKPFGVEDLKPLVDTVLHRKPVSAGPRS